MQEIYDEFSIMASLVRIEPTSNVRFIAEELRRYGIRTNNKNEKDKTIFYQSAHLIAKFDNPSESEETGKPEFGIVGFKDLFHIIGKNDDGVDDQDIVRVWHIADKLEKRKMVKILGTSNHALQPDENPNLPDVFANLHHIHRNDNDINNYIYKSKFATNKSYNTNTGRNLYGISDFFVLV
jgi:hypothetical protein